MRPRVPAKAHFAKHSSSCRLSRVHRLPRPDYRSSNHFGFFAHDTGDCEIRFPEACNVVDVFQQQTIGERLQQIKVPAQINDALLFHYVASRA